MGSLCFQGKEGLRTTVEEWKIPALGDQFDEIWKKGLENSFLLTVIKKVSLAVVDIFLVRSRIW
jgi:hypothetical protein